MKSDESFEDSFGRLDEGLRAGFGRAPRVTVLADLERRTGSSLRLTLPDADADREPVVRPVGPGGASAVGARYHVLGEIARGGLGVVMKSRDQDLGRDVAIKVLHERFKDDRAVIERFVEEAQIGGQLQHPGVVPVYELGLQADERPFFAMKLVKGDTLAALLKHRRDARHDRQRFLRIFLSICQTVAYAHARRVVHRDLKPSNVLIGAFGEVQVVDWGLAKVLRAGGTADESAHANEISVIETVRSGEGSSQSVAGSVLGTPAYMAPEQARGEVGRMDARSDVFSLGALLVEILSGRPLYEGEDPGELIAAAAECRTGPALERLAGIDDDLVDLVGACLAPAPSARPDDAGVLAERIEEHLQSVEDRARRAEVRAAETRVRARAALALAGLIVAGLAVTMALWAAWTGERNERRLDTERRVNAAVREATRFAGQAEQAGLAGVELWASALSAVQEAAVIVDGEEVDPELASEVTALVAELDEKHARTRSDALREKSHAVALERLREARIGPDVPRQDISSGDERRARESSRRMAAYATILAELGLDDAAQFDELAASFECEHRGQLAQALDALAEAARVAAIYDDSIEPEAWRRWVRLARHVDPEDPWRNNLRDELSREELDAAALGKLADSSVLRTRTAEEIATLVALIDAAGDVRGAADAQLAGLLAHPTDFWLNVSFAGLCVQEPMMMRVYLQRAQWTARAALALRPDSRRARFEIAWPNLVHDVDEALARIDELLADDPDSPELLEMKLTCLTRDARFEEAAELLPDPATGSAGTELTPFLTWTYAPAFTALGHGDRMIACSGLSENQRALLRFALGRHEESWATFGRIADWPNLGPWRQLTPVLREASSAEELAALHRRLTAMAEGDESARAGARPRDLLAAAQLTAFGIGSPIVGAELARIGLEGDPGPDEVADPRISKEHMSLAAAFASGALTPSSARLSSEERSALRHLGLETLNQGLDRFETHVVSPDIPAALLAEIEDHLTGFVLSGLLAPLRAERFLAEMPPDDAHACRLLGARVAALEAMMMSLHDEG